MIVIGAGCSTTKTLPEVHGDGRYPNTIEWCSMARLHRDVEVSGDSAGLNWLLGIADSNGLLVAPEGVRCSEWGADG